MRGSVGPPVPVLLLRRLLVVARRRRVGTLNAPPLAEEAREGSKKARREEDVDALVAMEADSARLSERRSMMVVWWGVRVRLLKGSG